VDNCLRCGVDGKDADSLLSRGVQELSRLLDLVLRTSRRLIGLGKRGDHARVIARGRAVLHERDPGVLDGIGPKLEIGVDRLNPGKLRASIRLAKRIVVGKRKDVSLIEVAHLLDDVADLIALKLGHAALGHQRFKGIRLLLLEGKKANRFGSLDGFIHFKCLFEDHKL
jgi:hypothetical protein